jgi:hypothetical protein
MRQASVANQDRHREKELMRAQLNALKYLQARQHKQLKQMEKACAPPIPAHTPSQSHT